ncbi:NAD(P)/FAD-dependent oxidoreductase [Saccharopolyspora sp. NFXS83]|uniref:flavin-containing monooxygenase n=1 Tax=Saccharopolyspora sp. NFXS83 TaxID=2993560 RepID=UPI00224A7616|nr:NAD(P)/FAD-dependent oxidoreductase [Saccharopolyspora sp. NFXS83]MCX2729838.1 NAD(P)/FAD-dependent oxidoreductase [Saccharopolyspora sp. NFXS83]
MSQTLQTTTATSARDRAQAWLAEFEAALTARDAERAANLFATTSFWRDLVAFTWNLKTVENRDGVADLLRATMDAADAREFRVTEEPAESDGIVEAWFGFDTAAGRGEGHLRLTDEGAWTLLTTLHELTGFEEPSGHRRPMGAEHGVDPDRRTWREARDAELAELGGSRQPYVLVVGGGQGGIALGARLRQLGVPHLVVDQHERPGDQWRGRYKSLCLHDPVWYDHLPYLDFPRNWPVFAPKDKIADWLEMYTKVMEINYWGSTRCASASYDDRAQEWTVELDRDGTPITLRPKQLVLATGVSGKPNVPAFPGQDRFRGEQHHSSRHPGPDAYRGERAVVVGSNNSAFDICAALWEAGADVTMVQRSSTHISKSDSLRELSLGPLYSEEAVAAGMTTQKADMTFASMPYRIMPRFQKPAVEAMKERDADFYARLAETGFLHDFGDDDSGLFMKYLRRGSGYYIDVGAAELITDGRVKLAHGQVAELTEDSVLLADGTELPADLVVYATGYGSMNGWAADLIGQDVADKVGKVWGLGSDTTKDPGPWEGEQRNMWKPTRQEGLWFHGGNLHQSRHYSLYLALQLKARAEGIPTPVYGVPEVHHTA